jgi:signal transduction histidine kinase
MDSNDRRIERFLRISREMSVAEDFRQLLYAIVSAAAEILGCETASVLEYDAEGNCLRFLALPRQHRKILEGIVVPIEGSIAGLAFTEKQPVSIKDAPNSNEHFKGADQLCGYKTRSVLAVPILLYDRPIGVMEAVNKRGTADYTGEDATILESLASQVALVLENQHLKNDIEKTREEATRLDKMKNDFIAITSHELRTPLGLILGHSTFLREIVDEEYRDQLDTIIRNATRLKEIIENMTNMDNFQSGMAVVRRRSISVRRIIQETLENVRAEAAAKKLTVRTELSKSELLIEGDAEKIGIVLSNIIKNAVGFTNPGGHVFIVAEQIPGYVKVSIVDNGIGIPAKDLPHIFERFYQVESHLTRKHGGMGLGLSVAKMMVEMHGGRIWAESVEGKGSNFTILLPLDSVQAEAAGKVFIT